ncbi:uncharacterized protein CcaverHIS019_0508600 [Cutaneotrichosporon cavernicola]|uniref:Uncharacterized protein n=1 Tax=Cutaneotrichosporon cavernicola TaxID=279322 RepID=A0AA48L7A2_9TREE|nr:uncharacterized protein CcaverHIS019_0508600 [Cutaneotrichosporon cavernicola]BEI93232.1 hypothetical protein CcaverHIS019_0508600 [Cutaneotrichosporon cavernicola]
MPVLGRISSNRDNGAIYSGCATVRKPRLTGIGKAPNRSRLFSGTHAEKAAKILRAYRKASLRKDPRLPAALAATKVAHQPIPEAAAQGATAAAAAAPVLADSQVSVNGFIIRDHKGRVLRVPKYLPKHPIAPNPHMTMLDGTVVSTLYVQDCLAPLLQRIYSFGTYFQPFPHVPSPPTPDSAMADGLRKSFAWGVPYIINGHDLEGTLAATVRPFQPDVCLAVRKRGDKDGAFHMTAINYTVYAAFFAYFPRRFNIAPSVLLTDAITKRVGNIESSPLSTCEEAPHVDDMEAISHSEHDGSSSISSASVVASLEIGEHIHLPILALELPDPETMPLIHERVHHPFTKWQPALLGLNLHQAITPEAAQTYLAKRSLRELCKVLATIQGVWKNISALGLENDPMWRELGSAYHIVMSIILDRVPKQQSSTA